MRSQITVQVDELGPALLQVRQRDRDGNVVELTADDRYREACQEAAYARLLAAGHRLPAGSVEVLVGEDDLGRYAPSQLVGSAIARQVI